MFEGGGFGVGVTVTPLDVEPYPVEFVPAGVTARPTRLGEMMPVAARTDAEIAVEMQRVQQMEARLAAYTAELIAELAARRPDSLDRQLGEPGAASPDWLPGPGREAATGVSEFFADELAVILNCSRTAATRLADSAALLTGRLPATWAALADGRLDWPRARALAAELLEPAREVEPHLLAEVEAALLPRAARLSISGLRAAARSELLRRDAAAADRRRRQAERAADVVVRPARDGLASLSVDTPAPLAAAIWASVDGYARMAKADGDPRPMGQLRVGVLADLVLRPWDTSRPAVTAHLTVLAPAEHPHQRRRRARRLRPGPPRFAPGRRSLGRHPSDRRLWSRRTRRGGRAADHRRPAAGPARAARRLVPRRPPGADRCQPDRRPDRSGSAARCVPPSPARNWSGWFAVAARTIRPGPAPARCWTGRRPWTATSPHRRSAGSSGPGTAPAAIRVAATMPPGPTSTTSSPMAPAG